MRTALKKLEVLVLLAIIVTLGACAGPQSTATTAETTQPPPSATVHSVQQAKPLDARFSDILVNEIKATEVIKTTYPEALADLESSLIAHLRSKKAYPRVAHNSGNAPLENTLFVNLTIPDMRIPSSSARTLGGPLAGKSYLNIELELVDAASGETLRKETIASGNSPMSASWNFSAGDRSLPADMGVIVAEYIYTVVPPLQ